MCIVIKNNFLDFWVREIDVFNIYSLFLMLYIELWINEIKYLDLLIIVLKYIYGKIDFFGLYFFEF